MKLATLIAAATLTIAATSQASERVALSSPIVAAIPITGFIYESKFSGEDWIVRANPVMAIASEVAGVSVGVSVTVTVTPADFDAAAFAVFGSADVLRSQMKQAVEAAALLKLCAFLQVDPTGISLIPYVAPVEDEEPIEEAAQ